MEGKEMEEDVVKDMTPRLIKDLGMRYVTEKSTKKYRYGLYECQYCGNTWETSTYSMKCGDIRSCGCVRKDMNKIHGFVGSRFYYTWRNMIARCNSPQNKNYKLYGARGITVCNEWSDIATFVAWAEATHPNIEGYTLDRIDNDKGYSPENCRWADATTQCVNQRIKKNNTSGYVGVAWNPNNKNWRAFIDLHKVRVNIGSFKQKEEAVQSRDKYIIENKLPHKLSTEYNKETK
jgi:hypothetical protein